MFRTSAISFVIAMIFSSMIGTSFLGKGYHLRGGIGRWGEWCFDLSICSTKVANLSTRDIGGSGIVTSSSILPVIWLIVVVALVLIC